MTGIPRRMPSRVRAVAQRGLALVLVLVAAGTSLLAGPAGEAAADDAYKRISGSGSTWSQNAISQWISNIKQYGITVDYAGGGSSVGRQQFANGTVDFAVSEIPFGVRDGASVEAIPSRKFAYMPIVAGGTSFMYNLVIGGKRVTSLRLSGDTLANIFTGAITSWDDAAIKADNPGLTLPPKRIVPVVRSDGSGTTAQFTAWMVARQMSSYQGLCTKAGRSPCTQTSNFPALGSFVAKSGSDGVAGFVAQAQNEGSITYVEYSYAKNAGFPVAKLLNDAGYYTLPTAQNVAVGLLGAQIDTDAANPATYLTQKLAGVYANKDPRAYPMSSYSYMVLPTAEEGTFTADKGRTLGAFGYYFLCAGQQNVDDLGYSPLPINLVQAGLDQIKRVPGVNAQSINVAGCNNPTFSASGENTLAKTAPQPAACDKKGPTQCGTAVAGAVAGAGSGGGTGTGPGAAGPKAAGTGGPGGTTGAGGSGTTAGAPGAGAQVGTGTGSGTTADGLGGTGGTTDGSVLLARAAAAPVAVEVAPHDGWQPQYTLMALTAIALGLALVGPALLLRNQGRP